MAKRKKKKRHMLLDAAKTALRRLLDVPEPALAPGDRCRVSRSLVADTGGTLLRGSLVEITGVQDPKRRYQVRIIDIPDYQWTETNRLPYGPNFLLFVEENALERIS